jgi:ABC-type branched-subunit amino acid transport system substrate-binding protein
MSTGWRSRSRFAASGSLVIALSVSLAACGSGTSGSGGGGGGSGGDLVVGDIWPYSGALAEYGIHSQAGCLAAAYVIKQAGGVLGHQVRCAEVDDKADSVDAVPVVQKFLATTSNLLGVSGPETDTSLALAPVLNQAKVPWISYTGSAFFDTNTSPYFYRMALADAVYGAALVYGAHLAGYKRAVILLGTNTGAADLHTGMLKAFKKLNSPKLVLDLSIAIGQPSYNTEVARLAALHPDVILGEMDPQTATTFVSDLKARYHLIHFVTDATDLTSQVFSALDKTIGAKNVVSYIHAVSSQVATSGAGEAAYRSALQAIRKTYPTAMQYVNDPQAQYTYDSVLIFALAAEAAHSANAQTLNGYITKVTNGGSGATAVTTFAAGKQALAKGRHIRYIGLIGPIHFDAAHTSTPPLQQFSFLPNGSYVPTGSLPNLVIQKLVS